VTPSSEENFLIAKSCGAVFDLEASGAFEVALTALAQSRTIDRIARIGIANLPCGSSAYVEAFGQEAVDGHLKLWSGSSTAQQ
jgi:hypothetical protein